MRGEPQVREARRQTAEMVGCDAIRRRASALACGGEQVVAWTLAGLGRKSLAVPGDLRSLTSMAPQNRPQLAHHPKHHANATLDAASVEAVARRVVELMRGEGASSSRGLVDAATLAAEFGVTRSWIYEHRDELGGVRLGTGAKPRLRFDVQRAREALIGGSQRPLAGLPSSTRPQSPPVRRRGRRRSADNLPRPGGVLAVRPRGATRPPGAGA
jgi:hypothetical protein